MNSFRAWIRGIDLDIWLKLHSQWRAGWLDALIPFVRNQFFWAPLYLLLAVFVLVNFGRRGLLWCCFFLLCFGLADSLSASVLKPFFHRVRPCNNPSLQYALHLIVPRSNGYSFPSSHATNHFALATFIAFTFRRLMPKSYWVFWLWAVLVCYAQVYVGVHFPADVAAGAVLGFSIGAVSALVFNRRIPLLLPATQRTPVALSAQ